MTADFLAALRSERQTVLAFCADLTDAEWAAPSRADGWDVQDVVAHLGAGMRSLITPAALAAMTSRQIERLNDRVVAGSRSRSPQQVLADLATWSRRGTAALGLLTAPVVGRVPLPVGELGGYPLALFPAMFTFDWHTHLRHDIAPAIGRPAPPTDERRMTAVLAWLVALLERSHRSRLAWLDSPVALTLHGAGGRTWRVEPAAAGRLQVRQGTATGTVARIDGQALQFPLWSTRRTSWRANDVEITGDTAVGERFLDALNLV